MADTEDIFSFLNADFMRRASVYPGSVGTFRYRIQQSGKVGDGRLQAWAYENVCFEKAKDVETEIFPWTDEGAAQLRAWLNGQLRRRGSEPYRIPMK